MDKEKKSIISQLDQIIDDSRNNNYHIEEFKLGEEVLAELCEEIKSISGAEVHIVDSYKGVRVVEHHRLDVFQFSVSVGALK